MYFQLQIQTADPACLQVERFIRRQIELGNLKPRQKLASNGELAKQWHVSCTVVQKALSRLTAEGMLERTPCRGTFVTDSVNRAVIGVLFGPSLMNESAYFYRAIAKALKQTIQERGFNCRVYYGLTGSTGKVEDGDPENIRNLTTDLVNSSFRGMIEFAPGNSRFGDRSCNKSLPTVCVEPSREDNDLRLDGAQFGWDSVDFFVRQGRRKTAFFRAQRAGSPKPNSPNSLDGFLRAIREFNLPPPQVASVLLPTSGIGVERHIYEKALQLTRQWQATPDPAGRPDALLVNDNIVFRAVAPALIESKIKIPDDLLVVTLAHEGFGQYYGFPVIQYEFSPMVIACQLVDLLFKRLRKQALPPLPIIVRGKIKETDAETPPDVFGQNQEET